MRPRLMARRIKKEKSTLQNSYFTVIIISLEICTWSGGKKTEQVRDAVRQEGPGSRRLNRNPCALDKRKKMPKTVGVECKEMHEIILGISHKSNTRKSNPSEEQGPSTWPGSTCLVLDCFFFCFFFSACQQRS